MKTTLGSRHVEIPQDLERNVGLQDSGNGGTQRHPVANPKALVVMTRDVTAVLSTIARSLHDATVYSTAEAVGVRPTHATTLRATATRRHSSGVTTASRREVTPMPN